VQNRSARFVSYARLALCPKRWGSDRIRHSKALKLARIKLDDIDLIELNEAFASQTLSVIQVAGLPGTRQT